MPPAEVIAVANHKGGVCKTFTSVNLATGLARAKRRTLLVDCDPQANATSMFDPADDVEFDLFDLVRGGTPITKVIRETRIENLDLLPSTLAVASLDQDMIGMTRREDVIRRALEPVLENYDVMILDLSPNLGTLNIAALSASSSLIIPTDASRWGRRAVGMFLEWSEALREARALTADLLGVVLTKYEETTRISRDVLAELRASGVPMFDTLIPKRVAAERMVSDLVVLGDSNADPDLTNAYGHLTVEVLDRVVTVQANRGKHRG